METIVASSISAIVAIVVCLISSHSQNEKSRALIEYKLDELTKKVEVHNNLIDRMYKVEKATEIHSEQIKVANHRIEDLEKGA